MNIPFPNSLPESLHHKDRSIRLLQYMTACAAGLVLGAVFVWFGGLWALIALLVVGFGIVVLCRPEIGLLGILVATSSIVPESELPILSLGGIGSLHIPDIVLLSLLVLILVRSLVEPRFKIVHTPLDLPLLSFYAIAMVFSLYAVSQGSVNVEDARRAIRTITYFLTFFVVTNLIRTKSQLTLLLKGISFLAIIVALAMAVQFLLGYSVSFLPGRVEILNTAGTNYSDVTRVLPPGESLVAFGFLLTTVMLVLEKNRVGDWLRLAQWLLLGVAVVLTYNRSYWAISGLVFLLAD
jgi:VanZ family protein